MEELASKLAEKYNLDKEQEADLSNELHLLRLAWLEEGIRQGKETAQNLFQISDVVLTDLNDWIKTKSLRFWGRPSYLAGRLKQALEDFQAKQ